MVWDGMVYSSKIIYKTQNILKCSGLEYEEWIHYVSDEYESDFIDTGVYENEVYGSSVVYANTIKGNNKNTVNVFISTPKSEIDKIIAASEVSNHIVIAKEDKMLFSTWKENDEWSTEVNWWEIGESNIDSFTVLSKMSRNIKIKYLLLMPENRYDQREMMNNGMLFGGLMIVLLSGVVGAYLLLSRNFKKIEAILSKFGMNTQNKSEFEQIESMIDQLYSENDEIRRRIEKQENQILEKNLLEIMQRKYFDVKPVGLLLPCCQVNNNIFLLALKIENGEKTEKAKGLTWNAINCAFCEMVKGEQFYYTSDDRCQLYLFTFSENKEYKNEIILKAEFLCDFVNEKLGEKVVAAISEIDNNLEHISKLYDAVREAFEYRKLTGGNGIIDCDKITNSASVWEEALDVGNRLMYALEDGNYDFVQECLAEVFEFFEEASFPIVKGVVLHMYNNILEKLFERECSEIQRIRMIEYLNPLVSADSTRSIEKVLREVLDEFYKLIVKRKDSDLVEKVRQYITEHYWEDALNINQIAEVLRENSRMLSKTFRDETGEGILDYISRERIKQAVILLNENKYSLASETEKTTESTTESVAEGFQHDPILNELGAETICKEKVTLTVAIKANTNVEDYETNHLTKLIEEKANVDLQFVTYVGGEAQEKLRVQIAGNEKLPDIIMWGMEPAEIMELGEEGFFVPLEDYYANSSYYAVEGYKKWEDRGVDVLDFATTADGHIWQFQKMVDSLNNPTSCKMWVYRPWLEAVGMTAEDIKDADGFYEMLTRFKNNDPNGNGIADEIPLIDYSLDTGNQHSWVYLMNAFTATTPFKQFLRSENGELSVAYTQDEFKEGVWHIDLPVVIPTFVIMLIMNAGRIMSVGFEKVFLLQNELNLEYSEIISTYVYKKSFATLKSDFGYSTAVSLFNSVINIILLTVVNKISKKVSETSLW